MQFNYKTLKVSIIQSFIVKICLDRPSTRNAMNTEMVLELIHFFKEISNHNYSIRCLLLTSSTEGNFCSGADLKERLNMQSEEWLHNYKKRQYLVELMYKFAIPIIAAVDGPAFGGGCELALACDFIYASSNASFALSETRLGIIPGAGGTQFLPRAIGVRKAKELIYTGNKISAEIALDWGLINKICDKNDLITETLRIAQIISNNAPISIQSAKQAIDEGSDLSLPQGIALEANIYQTTVLTNDRLEGITAFNERRKAIFKGN